MTPDNVANIEDLDKIIAAAKCADADSFISKFPSQYDTILSRLFQGGQELSVGQWQRICLARLFMKDAPVFVLDEPTASLDIRTEALLLKEINCLSNKKLCILISHRIFRKDICDRIVVLSDGKVIEAGSYENLLDQNGEFARLQKLYHNKQEDPVTIPQIALQHQHY